MQRTKTVRLVSGLSAVDADAQVARGIRLCDAGKRSVAFYLYDIQVRKLYQEFGYSSVIQYAVKRHRLKPTSARDLIESGRLLSELPGCDASFCEGRAARSRDAREAPPHDGERSRLDAPR